MPVCGDCGGTVIEYDAAAGNGFCVKCGTVVEENTIVSEVTFGETSNGAAIVQGSYIGQGSTHARMGGPFGNRGSADSREQTIANASKKIRMVASVLGLSDVVSLAAVRMYTLAVEHKFTKGRKNMNVVAVCLYIACRQKETSTYMLIDFSDLLQVNVFELGHTYLQLVQTLNLRLPYVDPSHYISRFASLLEFGDETSKVAMDATRLVQRFNRDWMTTGRRPAGICGACLLLAARMNNFRRSIQEIVQVVKIADTTLKKRLEEFRKTPSGSLTVADFRTVRLDDEMDPPAFTKGKEKEMWEAAGEDGDDEGEAETGKRKGKKSKKKKRKRGKDDEPAPEEIEGDVAGQVNGSTSQTQRRPIDLHLLNEGILAGTSETPPEPLFLPEGEHPTVAHDHTTDPNIDPALTSEPQHLDESNRLPTAGPSHVVVNGKGKGKANDHLIPPPISALEETVDAALREELNDYLTNPQGSSLQEALDEAERRRLAQIAADDELLGLDEDELDRFILTEEEVKIKERVWVEINKDYLEAIAARGEPKDGNDPPRSRKRRKTSVKPRDASTPHGTTAAESVRNLLKKNPKYSKRINYDALKDLFIDEPVESGNARDTTNADHRGGVGDVTSLAPPNIDLDDKDDDLYRLDDKSDGEGMLVVEEGGGVVGLASPSQAAPDVAGERLMKGRPPPGRRHPEETDVDLGDDDAEGEDDVELSEKGDTDYAWDEGYEQEV